MRLMALDFSCSSRKVKTHWPAGIRGASLWSRSPFTSITTALSFLWRKTFQQVASKSVAFLPELVLATAISWGSSYSPQGVHHSFLVLRMERYGLATLRNVTAGRAGFSSCALLP